MRCRLVLALAAALIVQLGFADFARAAKGKPVDVAICLDTSNSMDGLIDSAKIKLWAIVNDLALVKPTPVLRVALYQYGNDGLNAKNGWVQKELDLTPDLDTVYGRLNGLRTNGGTEYVARVCRDALSELKWSDEQGALHLIFVCGNEPVDQDREVKLAGVAEKARRQSVIINTIYCGPTESSEASGWRNFAAQAGGKYANIDQNRAAQVAIVKTPHDDEILKLNLKLNATYVHYGKHGRSGADNQTLQDNNAAQAKSAGAPVAALERASAKAGALYTNSSWDIVDRMKDDPKFDVNTLKEEELCDELKKLKPEELTAFVKQKADDRAKIQKEIQELSAKRAAYIQNEMKNSPRTAADQTFDEAVRAMIVEQVGGAAAVK